MMIVLDGINIDSEDGDNDSFLVMSENDNNVNEVLSALIRVELIDLPNKVMAELYLENMRCALYHSLQYLATIDVFRRVL